MDPVSTIALGINLRFLPTAEGGRHTLLVGGSQPPVRFTYRPNWGLPGWPDGDQTAAPVLGFSRVDIQPGDDVRAVIVALFPVEVPMWRAVVAGDELRMYEGSRVCGRGHVAWVKGAIWPMPEDEEDRFARWLTRRP